MVKNIIKAIKAFNAPKALNALNALKLLFKFNFLMMAVVMSFFIGLSAEAQNQVQPPDQNTVQNTDQNQVYPENSEILVTVLKGNPDKGGGESQEYQIRDGEIIFVSAQQSQTAVSPVTNEELAYEAQMKTVSTEIANKINDIEAKQQEYNNEVFLAFQAPIDLERQAMQAELQNLQAQRDKIESEQRAKQAIKNIQKATTPPPSPQKPLLASGLNVQTSIDGDTVVFSIRPKGLKGDNATKTILEAPFGQWVKVLGSEDTNGSEVWIKAEK